MLLLVYTVCFSQKLAHTLCMLPTMAWGFLGKSSRSGLRSEDLAEVLRVEVLNVRATSWDSLWSSREVVWAVDDKFAIDDSFDQDSTGSRIVTGKVVCFSSKSTGFHRFQIL